MIISKKRFEEEVQKRVEEAVKHVEENHWRYEREERQSRSMEALHSRLVECEKKCGIDHPSHHRDTTCVPGW